MESRSAAKTRASLQLLERDRERRQIRALFAEAEDGRGGLVTLTGGAGLGKTTLLAAATNDAERRGFTVLSACGHDLERAFPFGGAIQLYTRIAVAEVPPALWDGPAELARPLLARAETGAEPEHPDPGFPLLHGLYWLVANLAEERPVVLALDDAQWIDPATLQHLHYLLQRADGVRVAILLAVRGGEPIDRRVEGLLGEFAGHPQARTLALHPLGEASIRRLVKARIRNASDDVVIAYRDATSGNPFLLRELLGAAETGAGALDPGRVRELRPATVRRSILARLARQGESAMRLARALAVLGSVRSLEVAASIAGLEPAPAAAAFDRLSAAEMLRDGDALEFLHPILRDVVYESLPAAGRRLLHSDAARELGQRGARVAEIAAHLSLCDPLGEPWVAPVLRAAASDALRHGQAETAVRHLGRALLEPGAELDDMLLVELGFAEAAVGDAAALVHLRAGERLARSPEARFAARCAIGRACYVLGDVPGSVDAILAALRQIEPGTGGPVEAELLAFLSATAYQPETSEIRRLAQTPRLDPSGEQTPAELARQTLVAFRASLQGRRATAAGMLEHLLPLLAAGDGGEAPSAPMLPVFARSLVSLALAFLGRFGEAAAIIAPAIHEARREGNRLAVGATTETHAFALASTGNLRPALAELESLHEPQQAFPLLAVPSTCVRADILLERGDLVAATSLLSLPEEIEGKLTGFAGSVFLPASRARLALATQGYGHALDQALHCGELMEQYGLEIDYLPWRLLAARAVHATGALERALDFAQAAVDRARKIESPMATGAALATLGVIAGGEDGLGAVREAVELLDGTEAGLEQARARHALGVVLRHRGERREARAVLAEALQRARHLGASVLAAASLSELRLAGGRPRRPDRGGVDALTPAQLRVAELAAAGQSNKEIAAGLFVTLRTVETHLTGVYRALAIDSREELSDALRRSD